MSRAYHHVKIFDGDAPARTRATSSGSRRKSSGKVLAIRISQCA